ncbi:MAG TPA: lysylphosphatidylglycerol synthase transmembrane domain-containing protein [Thermoanaerobaculia bacterium]|nr:lysylphosphatidylglycerol synthase transmembrane domain-containing protein [Thermoanaerobaculia bacterium]
MPTRSRLTRFGVSIGLAVLLLWLFLRNLDFAAVGAAIRAAHPGWIAAAVVAGLIGTPPIRSWRWGRLLTGHPSRFLHRNAATSIGFAASTLLPARAGEIVRPVALSRLAGLPLTPCLLSIALERLIDLISTLVLFVVFAAGWAPTGLGGDEAARLALLRKSAYLLGAAAGAAILLLTVFALRPDLARRLAAPVLRLFPAGIAARLESVLSHLLEGIAALRSPRDAALVAAQSALLWLVICFQIWCTLKAFDLTFPFPVTFFVLTWGVMGLAIPTPGGVGGYHAAIAYCLFGFYGVPRDTAAAFALVSHAISFVPITLLGLGFLVAGGFSLRALSNETAPEGTPEAASRPTSSPPEA